MTVSDINNAAFERVVRGYKIQDVDIFLSEVAKEIEKLTLERDTALAEKDEMVAEVARKHEESEKKLYILAEKIEQYRADEENIKVALLNAQRLGESVMQEARQNAEKIVNDANAKKDKIYEDIKVMQNAEEKRLLIMRSDVSKFRADILNMYKNHIEQLNSIPPYEDKRQEKQPIVAEKVSSPNKESKNDQVEFIADNSAQNVQSNTLTDNDVQNSFENEPAMQNTNVSDDDNLIYSNTQIQENQQAEAASASDMNVQKNGNFEAYENIRFDG